VPLNGAKSGRKKEINSFNSSIDEDQSSVTNISNTTTNISNENSMSAHKKPNASANYFKNPNSTTDKVYEETTHDTNIDQSMTEIDDVVIISNHGNANSTGTKHSKHFLNSQNITYELGESRKRRLCCCSSFLAKRTRIEKIALALLFAFACLAIVFMFNIIYKYNAQHAKSTSPSGSKANESASANMCLTQKCLLLSANIYKSLNQEVDPCDDFYEYSCGKWIRNNLLPTGFSRWSIISAITYSNQLVIKDELEHDDPSVSYTEAERKAKVFYDSCLDKDAIIEQRGAAPFYEISDSILYVNKSTNMLEFNETFEQLLNRSQIDFAFDTLFQLEILDDDKNSTYSDIQV
jgi:hypothetical protein